MIASPAGGGVAHPPLALSETGILFAENSNAYAPTPDISSGINPYGYRSEIRDKALGPEHPDTATCLNNLAVLYHEQGKYYEAEPLFRRALAIWEEARGPDHPNTVQVRNNLILSIARPQRRGRRIGKRARNRTESSTRGLHLIK
ncbi:MAG TPA: tetratricopeptide repeat protein [Candidatus Angelobacter sp.]